MSGNSGIYDPSSPSPPPHHHYRNHPSMPSPLSLSLIIHCVQSSLISPISLFSLYMMCAEEQEDSIPISKTQQKWNQNPTSSLTWPPPIPSFQKLIYYFYWSKPSFLSFFFLLLKPAYYTAWEWEFQGKTT